MNNQSNSSYDKFKNKENDRKHLKFYEDEKNLERLFYLNVFLKEYFKNIFFKE